MIKSIRQNHLQKQSKKLSQKVLIKKLAVTKTEQGVLQFPDIKTRDNAVTALELKLNAKSEDRNFRSLMTRTQVYDLNENDSRIVLSILKQN